MKKILTAGMVASCLTASVATQPVFAQAMEGTATTEVAKTSSAKEKLETWRLKHGDAVGTITAINGSTLVITAKKDNRAITVVTDTNTQFRRRFGAESSLSEFSIGHSVNVRGVWATAERTQITATVVRDMSIQARHGTFIGTISSIDANTLILASKERGNQTVITDNTTKIVNAKNKEMNLSDIQVGHKVQVTGIWDRQQNKVTGVKIVRDWSVK